MLAPIFDGKRAYETVITPESAREILARSEATGFQNRRLRSRAIERFAHIMQLGKWGISNDIICITPDGKLINGQNRLHAVIKSGVPIHAMVMINAEENMYWYLDKVSTRTLSDFLHSMGISIPSSVSNAAFYILQILKYDQLIIHARESHVTYGREEEVLSLIDKHLELFTDALEYQKRMQRFSLIPSKACLVCHVLCSFANHDKAHDFFETLYSKQWGTNKTFISLFNCLQRIPHSFSEQRNVHFMKVLFYTWNQFCKGKEVLRINIPSDNSLPEIYGFHKEFFLDGLNIS